MWGFQSPHSQQKSSKCSTWVQSQEWRNDLCLFPRQFNKTVIPIYAPTTDAEEAEVEQFYDVLQNLLELILIQDILFIKGDWNAN